MGDHHDDFTIGRYVSCSWLNRSPAKASLEHFFILRCHTLVYRSEQSKERYSVDLIMQ